MKLHIKQYTNILKKQYFHLRFSIKGKRIPNATLSVCHGKSPCRNTSDASRWCGLMKYTTAILLRKWFSVWSFCSVNSGVRVRMFRETSMSSYRKRGRNGTGFMFADETWEDTGAGSTLITDKEERGYLRPLRAITRLTPKKTNAETAIGEGI